MAWDSQFTECSANLAVSSVAVNASGDDFYVVASSGSLYEHVATNTNIATVTPLVTATTTTVTELATPNADTDVIDYLFSNGTLWRVSGLHTLESGGTPNLVDTPLAKPEAGDRQGRAKVPPSPVGGLGRTWGGWCPEQA